MSIKTIDQIFLKLEKEPSQSVESETIEFKNYKDINALNNDKELANEFVALANKFGGKIIIGVIDNDKNDLALIEKQLNGFQEIDFDVTSERLRGRIKPKIDFKIYYHFHKLIRYVVIDVPKINHVLVTTTSGKVYIRDGKSSRPMEPYEIESAVKNLQTYDWSADEIDHIKIEELNQETLIEAKKDFIFRRNLNTDISNIDFLEAINATKNGVVTKTAVLMFGHKDQIKQHLGDYEFRFSYKSNQGELLQNYIWSDNIWNSIKIIKNKFSEYNKILQIEFNDNKYNCPALDEKAFHEALLNAIVHRDYSINGLISIIFTSNGIKITNPGNFYGGVNESNIAFHDPRHRNKELAKCLMLFNLVDRAGMGVLRMGIGSLIYGRSFPIFCENNDSIEVSMVTEYCIPQIFVITTNNIDKFKLSELFILNKVSLKGTISCKDLEKEMMKISLNPWEDIKSSIEEGILKHYFVIHGDKNDIFISVSNEFLDYFKISKKPKIAPNSSKYVSLYTYLKKYNIASSDELSDILTFSNKSSLSSFLSQIKFIQKKGNTRNTRWSLT